MNANIKTTENPVARPATAERLRSECNGGFVLGQAAVVVLPKVAVVVLAKTFDIVFAEDVVLDGEGTFNFRDELNVEEVMVRVLELKDVVMFRSIIKPRLVSELPIKPGGLPVDVSCRLGRQFGIQILS